jgi:acetolactate synthase-1/2/3 large subunit
MTTVANAIMATLADAGVTTVFGLPGVHNLAFWEPGEGLPEIVGTRHEQTTVYAADGLARATGGLGVAFTTTGPGVANAAGAFGEAARSGSPVLLLTSEVATTVARPGVVRGGLHESADQAAMFEPLAKAVFRPRTAADAVRAVAEAAQVAMQWPRGPVYVDVPTDVLGQQAEPLPVAPPARLAPDAADVTRAVGLIGASERVVLWVGGGAVQSDAGEAVTELAERLAAPVVATWAGRGVVPAGHPWSVDLPPHEPAVADLLADADLMIAIGTEFDGPNTKNWTMPRPPALISVNVDPVDVAKNFLPDIAIVADARMTVVALLDRIDKRDGEPAHPEFAADERTTSALALVAAVDSAVARHDATVVNDMAIAGYWVGGYGRFAAPRRMQYPVGWGTLGYALPAAVGVGATHDRPVLAICGDGGFMFAVGELAVLVEQRMPVTVLLVDDGGYGMLRFDQDHTGSAHRGVDLVRPDFLALAAAFGIPAVESTLDGLADALGTALDANGPRLVLLKESLYPPRTISARWSERGTR